MSKIDFASIKAIAFDFDGVFTDNRVMINEKGEEAVFCNRSDGLGLLMLRKAGIHMIIISKEWNPVVLARAKKLSMDVIHKCDDKLPVLKEWMTQVGSTAENTVFMGNDLNDLECMEYVNNPVAPSDALSTVLQCARYVTTKPGGKGAIRELADLILQAQGHTRYRA